MYIFNLVQFFEFVLFILDKVHGARLINLFMIVRNLRCFSYW